MVSQLESALRKQVAAALKGQLLTCTLRRVTSSAVNSYGDPVPGTASSWSFDGFVDTFNLAFIKAAGIPTTDVRVLIIMGSLSTSPQQDDQVKVRDAWYQLRSIVERDPAGAQETWSAYGIEDPTA